MVIGLMQGAYVPAADTLQRAVRFGGSSIVGLYDASQQPPQGIDHTAHTYSETVEHDHCMCVTCRIGDALGEKNGRISRLDTARLQLLTSIT